MDAWVEDELLGRYAHRVEFNWQPSDLLPSSSAEDFVQQVTDLRARCAELPDDFWVCLAGNTVSEEGLPNSSIMLNTLDGTRDDSGADMTPWARWTRAWTGEESRHGKVLHQYLYLSGQVNMHALEKTSQYLVNSGMDPKTENNPYLGFVYATFVERATFLSHRVMAARAQELGDLRLAKICGVVAGDEKRHEIAYGSIVTKLMELDPDGTILSFADMMKKQMVMPAHMMKDGESPTLFMDYSEVAQRCGVYTSFDYADIVEHLVRYWKVREQKGLSPDAEAAQQYLCKLPDRVRRLAERTLGRAKKGASARVGKFSWVFNREVALL
jgi:acyl-[acyl-carrier-protein] desaturase